MDEHPLDPLMPETGLLNELLQDIAQPDELHLCPRCGAPIEDPLEECPTCAAELGDEDEDWP